MTLDKLAQIPEVMEIVRQAADQLTNLAIQNSRETRDQDDINRLSKERESEILKPLAQRVNKILQHKGLIYEPEV